MNKKGQMNAVGYILVGFVTLIVGLALIGVIFQNVGDVSTTVFYNESTSPQLTLTNGTTTNLNGKSVANFLAYNESTGAIINADNYTIANNQIDSTTGELTAQITPTADAVFEADETLTWNVSYTYEPVNYISDSGSRSVASLIAIFSALAILIVAIAIALKNGGLDFFR